MAANMPPEEEKGPLSVSHGDEHQSDKAPIFESIGERDEQDLPPRYYRSINFIGTMFAAQSAFAGGTACFNLASPLLGIINADIGPSPNIVWVALAYTLPLAVLQTLVGRLSDIFGRRWFFIIASLFSVVGSIVCALAPTVNALIAGTALLGVGAAGQVSVVYVVGELVPMKHRFLANGWIYIGVLPCLGLGPAISYGFVLRTAVGWRGCYWLVLAINAFSTLCWVLFYHPPSFRMLHKDASKMELIKKLDYIGLFIYAGGFIILLMGLLWGGNLYPWNSAHVIVTITVGAVAMIAFCLWETYAKLEEPLTPPYLFNNGGWVAIVFLCAFSASTFYGLAVVWPQMVFTIYTDDYFYGGFIASLTGAGTNIGMLLSGVLTRPIGHEKYQMIVCAVGAVSVLGACACATFENRATIYTLATLGSLFTGYIDSVGLAMLGMVIKDQRDIGSAVGIGSSIRGGVSTFATAIYTIVLSTRQAANIPSIVGPAVLEAGLPESSLASFLASIAVADKNTLLAIDGVDDAIITAGKAAYRLASLYSFRTVFLSTIAFSGAALVLACLTPNAKRHMTGRVAAVLHGKSGAPVGLK